MKLGILGVVLKHLFGIIFKYHPIRSLKADFTMRLEIFFVNFIRHRWLINFHSESCTHGSCTSWQHMIECSWLVGFSRSPWAQKVGNPCSGWFQVSWQGQRSLLGSLYSFLFLSGSQKFRPNCRICRKDGPEIIFRFRFSLLFSSVCLKSEPSHQVRLQEGVWLAWLRSSCILGLPWQWPPFWFWG